MVCIINVVMILLIICVTVYVVTERGLSTKDSSPFWSHCIYELPESGSKILHVFEWNFF